MRYVTPKYEKQLAGLAETLISPARFGDVALQDTVEIEAVQLRLCDPLPNLDYSPPPEAA